MEFVLLVVAILWMMARDSRLTCKMEEEHKQEDSKQFKRLIRGKK
jgi:hypothetical protein